MRAVLVHVTDQELAHRRSIGGDRWDEMWEGVLHMTPAPSLEHQRILGRLVAFLEPLLRSSKRGTLLPGVNVFRTATDYRIPDLTFVAAGREHVLSEAGVREGGPDAVIEIRSPEDETYEKLPFYASIGTREVVVIDRDTKQPEVYRLAGAARTKRTRPNSCRRSRRRRCTGGRRTLCRSWATRFEPPGSTPLRLLRRSACRRRAASRHAAGPAASSPADHRQ